VNLAALAIDGTFVKGGEGEIAISSCGVLDNH